MKKILVRDIRKIVFVIFCSAFLFTSYVVDNQNHIIAKELYQAKNVEKAQDKQKDSQEEVIQEEKVVVEQAAEVNDVETAIPAQPVAFGNSIQISNILNSPLMKDNDGDNFYLNHNLQGVYDGRGVPYIDFRTDFNTQKTIIYAHSISNGYGPFQMLQNYHNNKSYFDNNRFITIHYAGNTYTYEIFSVYVSLADSEESEGLEYFHNIYYDNNEWSEVIQKYKNNSEYDTGVSVNGNDKIVILQTCSMDPNYLGNYYRYNLLVMGKLI